MLPVDAFYIKKNTVNTNEKRGESSESILMNPRSGFPEQKNTHFNKSQVRVSWTEEYKF